MLGKTQLDTQINYSEMLYSEGNIDREAKIGQPTDKAYSLGLEWTSTQPERKQRHLGQFFTHPSVALFMAGLLCDQLCHSNKTHLRILDPGAGAGILACAVGQEVYARRIADSLDIIAYEVDSTLIPTLTESFKYLRTWLADRKIECNYRIINNDFILANGHFLERQGLLVDTGCEGLEAFDVIIMNPPYFKISRNDPRAIAASSVVYGQPNVYALFMAVGASMLSPGGFLVSITPRSFAAGPYFSRFREKFFSIVQPVALHLFGSRREAFGEDTVLQENVILVVSPKNANNHGGDVIISSSEGLEDLGRTGEIRVSPNMVIDRSSRNKVVHIPVNTYEVELLRRFRQWEGSLHKYNMEISTGPVVPFRSREYLCSEASGDTVPLLWMQHVHPMVVTWPQSVFSKPQYIRHIESSSRLLLADKTYVLLRRFSSKEQIRRLTAAPLLSGQLGYEHVGVENHLNYIYRRSGQLTREEAYGLAALLNSELYDRYFRIFNGNTQVSATELRELPLPSLSRIRELGGLVAHDRASFHEIDDIVTSWFELDH